MDIRKISNWSELVPAEWIDRIRRCEERNVDPTPLKRQCYYSAEESLPQPPGFSENPLAENGIGASNGAAHESENTSILLKKYAGRSLILTQAGCEIHCRFCFRRHTHPRNSDPNAPLNAYPSQLRQTLKNDPDSPTVPFRDAVQRIASDPDCREVILSGGDPFVQSESLLSEEYRLLAAVAHVRRVRIHTRVPVIAPLHTPDPTLFRRVAPQLTTIVVLHVNHPLEIAQEYGERPAQAIAAIIDAGIPVLSQTTLLRGVNDSADVLTELMERLVDLRVIPYYLHQLDRVYGAAHFEVPVEQGLRIIHTLRVRLPGYAVPRYVREIPEQPYKTPL